MSVTKDLVAAAGWSMDATFQRDRQVKRPALAPPDDDDSAGESQGTIKGTDRGENSCTMRRYLVSLCRSQ